MEVFASWLVNSRWILLVFAITLGTAAWMIKDKIAFDNSIEGMFADDNLSLMEYQRLKEIFGGSEIVLAAYDDNQLFSSDGLQRLDNRSTELSAVGGVIGVLSLAEINGALKKVYSLSDLLRRDEQIEPILRTDDQIAEGFLQTFEGYTHNRPEKVDIETEQEDANETEQEPQTAAIVCLLEPAETLTIPRSKTIRELRRITSDWTNAQVTGEAVLVSDGFAFVRRDGQRLNQISLVLMAFVIVVCFRSIRWVMIPIAVFQLSLWMTLGLLVILDWKLTMVSSMLAAIVAVISVATIVHITVRYREARSKKGKSRPEAMEFVFSTLLMPITWTCLTTAAGFFALTIADVEPVSDFGWMMTFGSLFVLLNVLLVVPGLALLGNVDTDPQNTWGEGWLEHLLKFSSHTICRYPIPIGVAVVSIMGVIATGMMFLQVETDFTKNFREDSTIIEAYAYVEDRLGGAGMLDVVVQSPENLDREFLEKVDALQADLRGLKLETEKGQVPALTHVVSFADTDRIVRSNAMLALLPPDIRFHAMSSVMPGFAAQMKTSEPDEQGNHYFRIMLRTSQRDSAQYHDQLITRVEATVDNHFGSPEGESAKSNTMTTGFFVLLSNLVSSILADQLRTFLLACGFIAVVMLIAFGSPKLVVLALIPNILPIVGLLGMLGWLGIKMNMGAAMIAAVSLGLSIDGTIHYLSAYRHNKRSGMRTTQAIERTQFRTGRALIYATCALVIGFGSLCVSEFIPTVFFGGLVGLSMLGGMLGNLIVLPVLLTLFDGGGVGNRTFVRATKKESGNKKTHKAHGNAEDKSATLTPHIGKQSVSDSPDRAQA